MKSNLPAMQLSTEVEYSSHSYILDPLRSSIDNSAMVRSWRFHANYRRHALTPANPKDLQFNYWVGRLAVASHGIWLDWTSGFESAVFAFAFLSP